MNTRSLLGAGLILLVNGLATQAQTKSPTGESKSGPAIAATAAKPAPEAPALAAIRQTSQEFAKAFNAGDAKAIAALWTKDGQYEGETGDITSGREAIEKKYAEFFATSKGKRMQIVIDSLRMLSDSAAIEDGRAILEPRPPGASGPANYMAIHVKIDGRWLMSTVRDARSKSSSIDPALDDLEWLIGTWTAEESGSTTESVCRWIANKSFVERNYVVKHPDGTTASGLQLIGKNPQNGRLQSWNFSSDGGLAVGVWAPREKGWAADVDGTTGSGIPTTATNLLTRLDDNAYSWQSVSRTAGGVELPDTDEVVIKRQAGSQ